MKRLILAIFSSLFILTGCSAKASDSTFFIHSVGFEENSGKYKIYAVCEESGSNGDDFFTISQEGESIDTATKKIMDKYKNCYFATANHYFITDEIDSDYIKELSKEICSSNIYPSKSDISCIKDVPLEDYLSQIKNMKQFDKITTELQDNKINAVAFFSRILSENKATIPSYTLDADKNISSSENVTLKLSEENK